MPAKGLCWCRLEVFRPTKAQGSRRGTVRLLISFILWFVGRGRQAGRCELERGL